MSKVKSTKAPNVQRRSAIFGRIIVVVACLMLATSSWAWWHYVRNNPENTFQSMLVSNLRTGSVTRTVRQQSTGQNIEQVMRIQNQGMHVSHGTTTLQQGLSGGTVVVTDSIGTPTADYTKYQSITTTQKSQDGKELNFDDVINVWAKADVPPDQVGTVYQDTAMGSLFMFGDLNAQQRQRLLSLIAEKNIYEVDYTDVKKDNVDGRPKYIYKVNITPSNYITLMKQFAGEIGLTQLTQLDPEVYANASPLTFTVSVDVISQHLESVKSPNGAVQTFGGYGIVDEVKLPQDAIPANELQQRLSESASV